MSETPKQVDFERWYRELFKKFTSLRETVESISPDSDVSIRSSHLYRLKGLKKELRNLSVRTPTGIQDIITKHDKILLDFFSAYSDRLRVFQQELFADF